MNKSETLEEMVSAVFSKYKNRLSTLKEPISDVDAVCVLIRAGDIDDALRIIMKSGIDIAKKLNEQGNVIADVAAWNGEISILGKLLNLGVDINTPNVNVMGARHIDVLRMLDSTGNLSPNIQGDHGTTPLQQACNVDKSFGWPHPDEEYPRLECIEFLLDKGAAIDAVNDFGRTAIMGAAYANAVHIVRLLIKRGADVSSSKRCSQDKSAIEWAGSEETQSIIKAALVKH